MQRTDYTIHFTIKEQSLDVIKEKLNNFLKENKDNLVFDENTVLHHCFLPREVVKEKGFSTDLVDFLDTICPNQVRWFGVAPTLEKSRLLMLNNLNGMDGSAIFVGEIKEGVKEELDLAMDCGVDIIQID